MKNQIEFYEYIDQTAFSDVVNSIISIAALNDYNIDVRHKNTFDGDKVWKLYIRKHYEFIHYSIGFGYADQMRGHYRINKNGGRIVATMILEEFIDKLKELLEEI